jgi:hypothetical protein
VEGTLVEGCAAVAAAQDAGTDVFRHGSITIKEIKAEDPIVQAEQEMADAW